MDTTEINEKNSCGVFVNRSRLEINNDKAFKLEAKLGELYDKIKQLNCSNDNKDSTIRQLRFERTRLFHEIVKLKDELKRIGNTSEERKIQVEQMQLRIDGLSQELEETHVTKELHKSVKSSEIEVENELQTSSNHSQIYQAQVKVDHIGVQTEQNQIPSIDQNMVQSIHEGVKTIQENMNKNYSLIGLELSSMKEMQKDLMKEIKNEMMEEMRTEMVKDITDIKNTAIRETRSQMPGVYLSSQNPKNVADKQKVQPTSYPKPRKTTVCVSKQSTEWEKDFQLQLNTMVGSKATLVPQNITLKKNATGLHQKH